MPPIDTFRVAWSIRRSFMSESKQPPIESDATPVKKSSKKGVTRSSDSSLAASTFSIDNGLQIPRIALAEPKPDTDPKRKASKKRTVTTSRDVDGIAFKGPDASSTIDAAAAKEKEDAERDKQRRREAKRQRAKELEEAKRRQELEKEALEEAQRVHDQRQREARQKEQLEALNANAEECQEDAEDYDDEDFENYDEEFEKEESSPKSTLLPAGKFPLSHTIQDERLNPAMDVAELHRIQQAMQAETRGLESLSSISSRQPSARSDERFEVTKLATTLSSIAGLKQSLDPRAKRVKEIRERRKFEVEKFSLFQMNPMSEHDRVLHRLRRGLIKQAFVQTNDGARALGTQTKAPKTHDKSMHFPDDIGLDVTESASDEVSFTASTSRFFRFLEHASYVCECLAVENVMAVEQEVSDEKLSKSSDQSGLHHRLNKETKLDEKILFPCKREVAMGSLHELIQGRDLVALRFSPVVSSILLSCYGAPRNEAPEPMPKFHTKTISCVWDINRPTDPLHLLLSEGVAASALISPSRDLFVMIGTQDGTIHVWDLRPDSMIQSSTQLADNQAGCTPAYSTCGLNYLAPEQHASTIVALEVMDSSQGSTIDTNGTFQFGSLDDRGVFILWSLIEVKAGDDADKCVQTGGTVKLIMNTRIDLQPQNVPQPPRGSRTTESARSLVPLIGPMATTLKFLPRDINQ